MIIKEYAPVKAPNLLTKNSTHKKKRRRPKKKSGVGSFETLTMVYTAMETISVELNSAEKTAENLKFLDFDKLLLQETSEDGSNSTKCNSDTTLSKHCFTPQHYSDSDQGVSQQMLEPIYTKTFLTSFMKTCAMNEVSSDMKFYMMRRCLEVPIEASTAMGDDNTPVTIKKRSSYEKLGDFQPLKRSPFKSLGERGFKNNDQIFLLDSAQLLSSENLPLLRRNLTEEEKIFKEKIASCVGKWSSQIKVKTPIEQIETSIRFHLNILTPENYEIVKMELLAIAKISLQAVEKLSDLILEKAWNEVKYAQVYARLCDFLGRESSLFFQKDAGEAQKRNDFKVYTLRKIQHSFDCDSALNLKLSKDLNDMDPEHKALFLAKKKKSAIGNVNFIGELFIKNFLTSQIIRFCISSLLSRFLRECAVDLSSKEAELRAEDHLEALITLLENVGKLIEEKERLNPTEFKGQDRTLLQACKSLLQTSQKSPKIMLLKFPLNDVFDSLEFISARIQLSSRLRALLQNLNYRRTNNWKAPEFMMQQPKTLKEIREEVENEEVPVLTKAKSEGHNLVRSIKEKNYYPSRSSQSSSKVSFEQIIEEFRKAFKILDASEDEEETLKAFDRIARGSDTGSFTKGYLKTFSDGPKTVVSRRVQLFPRLINSKLINPDSFSVVFGECLFDLWMEASDFPGIEANYATVFADMAFTDDSILSNFYIHPSLAKSVDKPIILETYSAFFVELKAIISNRQIQQRERLLSDIENLIYKVNSLENF